MNSHPTNVLDFTQQLISIPSLTPHDEGCMELIIPRLKKLGFTIELFKSGESVSLWARYGDAAPLFCFVGHTDVVSPGDLTAWQSCPFTPTIRDNYLYGRGAADMKSAVAAFIVALENFLATEPRLKGSIALLITSAEESCDEQGTPIVIKALEQRQEKITYCLVGEPSSYKQLGDTIKNGRRGSLHGHLIIHGKQGQIGRAHV